MDNFDLTNGMLQITCAIAASINVYRLYSDKVVKGIHWFPTLAFTAYGIWGIVYFPHLGQPLSLIGACILTVVNVTWLCQVFYYGRIKRECRSICN